jgi:hypothetical protein
MSRKSQGMVGQQQSPPEPGKGAEGNWKDGLPEEAQGVFIFGRIVGRTKTVIPADGKDKPERLKVNYRIQAGEIVVQVADWDPTGFIPLESEQTIPVNVSVYADRRGTARYNLTIRRPRNAGESF